MARMRPALAACAEARFALAFGSAVSRSPESARDIDVAVSFRVSPSLLALGHLEGELERAVSRTVDLVDLDTATTVLRYEVARNSVPLWTRDGEALVRFRASAPLDYFDLQHHIERQSRGLLASLEARR